MFRKKVNIYQLKIVYFTVIKIRSIMQKHVIVMHSLKLELSHMLAFSKTLFNPALSLVTCLEKIQTIYLFIILFIYLSIYLFIYLFILTD